MYYISQNKLELEAYNSLVSELKGYNEENGFQWAPIIAHKNGKDYAIKKHVNCEVENLTEVESLSSDWSEII